MKKHALIPMLMVLIALWMAGCGSRSTPTPAPGGPQDGPQQGNPQQGGPDGGQPGNNVQVEFGADSQTLQPGQCADLQWSVQGGIQVRLDGQPVDPNGRRQVCPNATTIYRLEVDAGGRVEIREVTVQVGGGNPPAPTQKPGGGGGGPTPTPTATVKSGGGGGGSGPTHTPTTTPKTANGKVDIGILGIIPLRNKDVYDITVVIKNFGTKTWSASEDPSSSGDLEFVCSRSWTVGGKISTSTYNGSVPRARIDEPGEGYIAVPWWIDVTGVTAFTASCHISKGPTYDSDSSNDSFQEQWDDLTTWP